jgi:hypothetical protein
VSLQKKQHTTTADSVTDGIVPAAARAKAMNGGSQPIAAAKHNNALPSESAKLANACSRVSKQDAIAPQIGLCTSGAETVAESSA